MGWNRATAWPAGTTAWKWAATAGQERAGGGQLPDGGQDLRAQLPVQEKAGAVFVWFGDRAGEVDALLPEVESEEHSHFLCVAHWDCNYRYAVDNVMDPMHGAYLHAVSHSMASGEKSAVMQVVETEHGTVFERPASAA